MAPISIPILRWGQPYTSMESDEVTHFVTGESVAVLSRANAGLVQRDVRKAQRARELLRAIPTDDLLDRVRRAGDLYMRADLPLGDDSALRTMS